MMTWMLWNIEDELTEDTSSGEIIIQVNIQEQLDVVCGYLNIPLPIYTFHETTVFEGMVYRRYYGSMSDGGKGTPCVAVGRFGKDEYDAREDVAAILMRRIIQINRRKVRDYNYYNIEILEGQLKKAMDENFELGVEIAMLNEELRTLRTNLGKDWRTRYAWRIAVELVCPFYLLLKKKLSIC